MSERLIELIKDSSQYITEQDIMIEQQDYKLKTAKSEAINEFAERLLKIIPHINGETTMQCVENAIQLILTEMAGDA